MMRHQMQLKNEENKKRKLERRTRKYSVDYSWLENQEGGTSDAYEMTDVEKFEMEVLCTKVKPAVCKQVIQKFRMEAQNCMTDKDVARSMQEIIREAAQQENESPLFLRQSKWTWWHGYQNQVCPSTSSSITMRE